MIAGNMSNLRKENVEVHGRIQKTRGHARCENYKNTLKNIEKNKNEKRGQSSKSYRTRTRRTQKNHVDHNQEILKNEEKTIATHFGYEDGDSDYGDMDVTHLEIGDFFAHPEGRIDHLIGDGTVKK
jgi:hypothetical protein